MIPLGALRDAGLGDELDRATAEGMSLTVAEALELCPWLSLPPLVGG